MMVSRRGMNKKGDDTSMWGNVGTLVLVVAIVALVIWGIVKINEGIGQKAQLIPLQELTGVQAACENIYLPNAASSDDYCAFRPQTIDGKDWRINCEQSQIKSYLTSKLGASALPVCTPTTDERAKTECREKMTAKEFNGDVLVNGKYCSTLTTKKVCADYGKLSEGTKAVWVPTDVVCTKAKIDSGQYGGQDITSTVQDLASDKNKGDNKVCCLYNENVAVSTNSGDQCDINDVNSCSGGKTCQTNSAGVSVCL